MAVLIFSFLQYLNLKKKKNHIRFLQVFAFILINLQGKHFFFFFFLMDFVI